MPFSTNEKLTRQVVNEAELAFQRLLNGSEIVNVGKDLSIADDLFTNKLTVSGAITLPANSVSCDAIADSATKKTLTTAAQNFNGVKTFVDRPIFTSGYQLPGDSLVVDSSGNMVYPAASGVTTITKTNTLGTTAFISFPSTANTIDISSGTLNLKSNNTTRFQVSIGMIILTSAALRIPVGTLASVGGIEFLGSSSATWLGVTSGTNNIAVKSPASGTFSLQQNGVERLATNTAGSVVVSGALHLSGILKWTTGTVTVGDDYSTFMADTSAASCTLALPVPTTTWAGRSIFVIRNDLGTVNSLIINVVTSGAYINNAVNNVNTTGAMKTYRLFTDGLRWFIL